MPRKATMTVMGVVLKHPMLRRMAWRASLGSPWLRRAILRRAASNAVATGRTSPSAETKLSARKLLRPRRPFTVMTALGTAAHHTFEVRAGVGLVFEPFIGRRGAVALWATGLPAWAAAAWLGEGEAIEKWLALNNGAGLAGGIVHFVEWPWELRGGIPHLVEAEGMTAERLPAYNRVLQLWVLAGALALALETPRHARRWAFAGLLLGEPLRRSAVHHFRWAHEQAEREPERWSPVLRAQAHGRVERVA
jgi:hypothetical protein